MEGGKLSGQISPLNFLTNPDGYARASGHFYREYSVSILSEFVGWFLTSPLTLCDPCHVTLSPLDSRLFWILASLGSGEWSQNTSSVWEFPAGGGGPGPALAGACPTLGHRCFLPGTENCRIGAGSPGGFIQRLKQWHQGLDGGSVLLQVGLRFRLHLVEGGC